MLYLFKITKKFYLLLIFLFSMIVSTNLYAGIEKGKWNFVKDADYCYIGSAPTKIDIPEGKKRDDPYILVYRMNKNPDAFVQIYAGYNYKQDEPVQVKIDKKIYDFFSEDDSAWTNEDSNIIYAMKKGVELTVIGLSSRGTKTIDTYTLNGFTASFNKLTKDC